MEIMKIFHSMIALAFLPNILVAQASTELRNLEVVTITPVPYYMTHADRTNHTIKSVNFLRSPALKSDSNALARVRTVPRDKYEVVFVEPSNQTRYVVWSDEKFCYGTRMLQIKKVDISGKVCYLEDIQSEEIFKIEMTAQQSGAPLPRAPQAGHSEGDR